jgi:hypothetical protein
MNGFLKKLQYHFPCPVLCSYCDSAVCHRPGRSCGRRDPGTAAWPDRCQKWLAAHGWRTKPTKWRSADSFYHFADFCFLARIFVGRSLLPVYGDKKQTGRSARPTIWLRPWAASFHRNVHHRSTQATACPPWRGASSNGGGGVCPPQVRFRRFSLITVQLANRFGYSFCL